MKEFRLSDRRLLVADESEVSVSGKRGRFVFKYATERPGGVELTLYGGNAHHQQFTAVRPESIRAVHRIQKRRPTRGR